MKNFFDYQNEIFAVERQCSITRRLAEVSQKQRNANGVLRREIDRLSDLAQELRQERRVEFGLVDPSKGSETLCSDSLKSWEGLRSDSKGSERRGEEPQPVS
jgi:signal transduction histidine kinase